MNKLISNHYRRLTITICFSVGFAIFTCNPVFAKKFYYLIPALAEEFKVELKRAGIPFVVLEGIEGKEAISWDSDYDAQVERIKSKIIGEAPPSDRSMRNSKSNSVFIKGIKKSKIPYSIIKYMGVEYIVWPLDYSEKVRLLIKGKRDKAIKEYEDFSKKVEIEAENYRNVPQWSIDSKGEIPLSFENAISIARKWAALKWPNSGGVRINSITLRQSLKSKSGEWWNYYISMMPKSYALDQNGRITGELVIQMDGSVSEFRLDKD